MVEVMRMLTVTVVTALTLSSAEASHSSSTIRFCNRGYCYTRKEVEHHHGLDKPLSPSEAIRINRERQRKKRAALATNDQFSASSSSDASGLNFCTDSQGSIMDCELFEILGLDPDEVDAEYEALECVGSTEGSCMGGEPRHLEEEEDNKASTRYFYSYDNINEETIELDEDLPCDEESKRNQKGHISWKDRPQRGKCFDNDLGYAFDCNLVEILGEGLVLIEDLRLGGAVFAAKPKTDFSTRNSKKRKESNLKTPDVLSGSSLDPSEDWRTNVLLNLEGF